jgi:hypothetical protein
MDDTEDFSMSDARLADEGAMKGHVAWLNELAIKRGMKALQSWGPM